MVAEAIITVGGHASYSMQHEKTKIMIRARQATVQQVAAAASHLTRFSLVPKSLLDL